jgi:hypothetical protein
MLSWLARRRARIVRIEAEAEALIRNLGDWAYSEARRREHEASSDAIAKDWSRVALAVARRTGKRVGLDVATRLATDADFSLRENEAASIEPPPHAKTDPIEELARIVAENSTRPSFRLQFLGLAANRGASVLKEVDLRASDASEAVREAARLDWPPRALGFRLIDREGREIFGQDRG